MSGVPDRYWFIGLWLSLSFAYVAPLLGDISQMRVLQIMVYLVGTMVVMVGLSEGKG